MGCVCLIDNHGTMSFGACLDRTERPPSSDHLVVYCTPPLSDGHSFHSHLVATCSFHKRHKRRYIYDDMLGFLFTPYHPHSDSQHDWNHARISACNTNDLPADHAFQHLHHRPPAHPWFRRGPCHRQYWLALRGRFPLWLQSHRCPAGRHVLAVRIPLDLISPQYV